VCLHRKAGILKPRGHLAMLPSVDGDVHRVPSIALGYLPRLLTDVEGEHQRRAGPDDPVEVREDGGHVFVGDVDQRVPGRLSRSYASAGRVAWSIGGQVPFAVPPPGYGEAGSPIGLAATRPGCMPKWNFASRSPCLSARWDATRSSGKTPRSQPASAWSSAGPAGRHCSPAPSRGSRWPPCTASCKWPGTRQRGQASCRSGLSSCSARSWPSRSYMCRVAFMIAHSQIRLHLCCTYAD
jgi:hypothetical protein